MTIYWLTAESLVTTRVGLVLDYREQEGGEVAKHTWLPGHTLLAPPPSWTNRTSQPLEWYETNLNKKKWSMSRPGLSWIPMKKKKKTNDYLLIYEYLLMIDNWIPCHNTSGLGLGRHGTTGNRNREAADISGCRDTIYTMTANSMQWTSNITEPFQVKQYMNVAIGMLEIETGRVKLCLVVTLHHIEWCLFRYDGFRDW